MAGVGVKLNRIYEKHTLTTSLVGFGYSMILTIAPMILVIAAVLAMQQIFDVASLSYSVRDLYTCTVLYIFIFALLVESPFNGVLSRYISDVIYEERYGDILPCYYVGLFLNLGVAVLVDAQKHAPGCFIFTHIKTQAKRLGKVHFLTLVARFEIRHTPQEFPASAMFGAATSCIIA